MQCTNNLKQLALATHNYHDAFRVFPVSEVFRTGMTSTWGWGVFLLPFIEQNAMYSQLNPDGNALPTVAAQPLLSRSIPAYLCPSDAGGPINTIYGGAGFPTGGGYGNANYLPSDNVFTAQYLPPLSGAPVKLRDITDGTSNTLMIGERALRTTGLRLSPGGHWGGRLTPGGAGVVIGRAAWPPNTWYPAPFTIAFGGLGDPLNKRTAWTSNHTGGINAALCDGSIHFISENIDSHTSYPAAASTNYFNMDGINRVWQNLYRKDDSNVLGEF